MDEPVGNQILVVRIGRTTFLRFPIEDRFASEEEITPDLERFAQALGGQFGWLEIIED